jgi:segregation and condensation protein B
VTRAQIEEIRGAALGQATLDALLEASLIKSAGHRDVPGRPTLWATTPGFLAQFGLRDIAELPKRSELVLENIPGTKETIAQAEADEPRPPLPAS